MELVSGYGRGGLDGVARAHGALRSLKGRFERHRTYLKTVEELSRLSSRELADLGINRSEIRRVARDAVYDL